jgi:FkbM family methyltransferase
MSSSWSYLLKVNRPLEVLYDKVLTRPFGRYRSRFVARLPFRRFSFRPLFLQDLYMALGMWEPYVRQVLRSVLKPGSVFVDVGAHIGYYTTLAAGIVGPDGLVLAVEPDERNIKLLRRNCADFENVVIRQAALGVQVRVRLSELRAEPAAHRGRRSGRRAGPVRQKSGQYYPRQPRAGGQREAASVRLGQDRRGKRGAVSAPGRPQIS